MRKTGRNSKGKTETYDTWGHSIRSLIRPTSGSSMSRMHSSCAPAWHGSTSSSRRARLTRRRDCATAQATSGRVDTPESSARRRGRIDDRTRREHPARRHETTACRFRPGDRARREPAARIRDLFSVARPVGRRVRRDHRDGLDPAARERSRSRPAPHRCCAAGSRAAVDSLGRVHLQPPRRLTRPGAKRVASHRHRSEESLRPGALLGVRVLCRAQVVAARREVNDDVSSPWTAHKSADRESDHRHNARREQTVLRCRGKDTTG